MTLGTLRGPGLWLPQGPAQRVYGLCVQRKHLLESKDKATSQPQYRQVEAHSHPSAAMAESGAHLDSTELHVVVNKADARRAYEQEIIRGKKAAKEAAMQRKSSKQDINALKQLPEQLRKKIDALKM